MALHIRSIRAVTIVALLYCYASSVSAQTYNCGIGGVRSIGCNSTQQSPGSDAEAIRALTEELRSEEAARERQRRSDEIRDRRNRDDQRFKEQLEDMSVAAESSRNREFELYSRVYQNYQQALIFKSLGKYHEAINILKEIGSQLPEAKIELGMLYERGLGVSQNWSEAIRLYIEASSSENPNGYYYAARAYRLAPDGIKDIVESEKLYKIASNRGVPGAQYWVARNIYKEDNTKSRVAEVMELLKSASSGGYVAPLVMMANIYREGDGIKQNLIEAERLYLLAVDKNSISAMVNLGALYVDNNYGRLNYQRANELFKAAAQLGSTLAFLNLAEMYEYGLGVEIDKKKALFYNYVALQKGDLRARAAIARFEKVLREDDFTVASIKATVCLGRGIETCP